ncbi:hypothetical protein B7435_26870 [Mycolicibacterium peregrinum]|uniref:hypothetical protein n=1 Tax=Mycolicibacterium peregrinum TaxID=43304 RepID=UPI000B4B72E8|nr:hypothetical protein [Mycolicibacterium peregrinum]OWL97012.1 hypothetical protein B7435_26870 [Mycolicibacterium peregrinum]
MPRSYDLNPVKITHHPTQRLDTAIGKLPPFDIQQIIDGFLTALKDLTGIDLQAMRDFLENAFGAIDWSDLPTPEDVWRTVINTLFLPLNLLLTPLSALNASNLFGRIQLPQLPAVFLGSLTTASPNFLEPFSATSVPNVDGWSYDAVADAAKVVLDGSTKTLYLSGAPIKVEAGQPLNIAQKVRYTGVTSGAGQTIQYVLNTFTSDDGSGTATPVVVDGITNPSGTASTVTLGDSSWDPPVGVESVYPALIVDELATAGTVYWQNTPSLKKGLDSNLADGLAAAIQARINDMQETWDAFKGAAGGTVADIATALDNAGQGIRDAIANALGHSGTGHSVSDILTYLMNIPQDVIANLEDDFAAADDAIADVFDDLRDTWNKVVGGYRRTTATGQTSADVEEVMISVGQDILVAQESTITLANQANAPKNVPFWVSPNRFEEVSFPRVDLQPVASYSLNASTGAGTGLGVLDANWNAEERDAVKAHTHPVTGSLTVSYSKPLYTIPAGTLALAAVTMTQDRLINVARFLAGGGTPPATALYVGIYSIDPSTGLMTLVYDYGDQKGNINTGADLYETALNLPNDMLSDAGAMFAVGILPVGGSFAVAGVRRQPISTAAVIYPKSATELVSGLSSLPAAVADADMSHTATHRIWVSLGQAVESVPEDNSPVTLTMTFNVTNTSSWSSPSFQQYGNASSNFTVDDGQIYGGGPTVFIGDVTYWRSALCLTPVHTNDHMAEITLGTGWDDSAYGYATARAYVRCNSAGTSGVCLHVDATGGSVRVRIANITDMVSIGTVRATVTGIPYVVGDRFSVRAVGNVYQAYRNDDPIPGAVWTDSGSVVPIGKAWRRHGFGSGSRCTSGFTSYEPAHIDNYRAADLAA